MTSCFPHPSATLLMAMLLLKGPSGLGESQHGAPPATDTVVEKSMVNIRYVLMRYDMIFGSVITFHIPSLVNPDASFVGRDVNKSWNHVISVIGRTGLFPHLISVGPRRLDEPRTTSSDFWPPAVSRPQTPTWISWS